MLKTRPKYYIKIKEREGGGVRAIKKETWKNLSKKGEIGEKVNKKESEKKESKKND